MAVNELVLKPCLEHDITLPIILENITFLFLLVKSNIFWDNIEHTNHAKTKTLFE